MSVVQRTGMYVFVGSLLVLALGFGTAGCGSGQVGVAPADQIRPGMEPTRTPDAASAALGPATPEPTVAERSAPTSDAATAGDATGSYLGAAEGGERAGARVALDLAADGVAQMVCTFAADRAPVVEIGTWQGYADGSLSVVLETRIGEVESQRPTTLVLAPEGDDLVATDFDPGLFGEAGLRMTRQAAP